MTTALDTSADAPTTTAPVTTVPVRPQRGASLLAACLVLGLVAAGGLVLRQEPGQNVLDSWGFTTFPDNLQSVLLRAMSDLGLFPVTGGVALLATGSVFRRDRRRALACLAGPALAVGLAELLKFAVGRRFHGGALCWPSGTTAAVTAVVTVMVLVTRRWGRLLAVVLGSAVVAFEAVALVAFRWHYLTDTLGGLFVGVGSVLLVDALVHRIGRFPRRRPSSRRQRPV